MLDWSFKNWNWLILNKHLILIWQLMIVCAMPTHLVLFLNYWQIDNFSIINKISVDKKGASLSTPNACSYSIHTPQQSRTVLPSLCPEFFKKLLLLLLFCCGSPARRERDRWGSLQVLLAAFTRKLSKKECSSSSPPCRWINTFAGPSSMCYIINNSQRFPKLSFDMGSGQYWRPIAQKFWALWGVLCSHLPIQEASPQFQESKAGESLARVGCCRKLLLPSMLDLGVDVSLIFLLPDYTLWRLWGN